MEKIIQFTDSSLESKAVMMIYLLILYFVSLQF
jgi:hypothetical protein